LRQHILFIVPRSANISVCKPVHTLLSRLRRRTYGSTQNANRQQLLPYCRLLHLSAPRPGISILCRMKHMALHHLWAVSLLHQAVPLLPHSSKCARATTRHITAQTHESFVFNNTVVMLR
jgi:hypothetical protein